MVLRNVLFDSIDTLENHVETSLKTNELETPGILSIAGCP